MKVYDILTKVREQKPLVHHLTNWVTIYDCAQIVKSLGASPVMAHAKEEVADMASIASSLALNIGTLTTEFVESMKIATRTANMREIPVVLDVCGAGATKFRDDKCFELIEETRIDVIKGNASEIARIAGEDVQTKDVDASDVKKDLAFVAQNLARDKDCTVVVTGQTDIIADKNRIYVVMNGHEMMGNVVGTGCMATSVIGTFAAVEEDLVKACSSALVCFGLAAEISMQIEEKTLQTVPLVHYKHVYDQISESFLLQAPMSFKQRLIDRISRLNKEAIAKMQKVSELKPAVG